MALHTSHPPPTLRLRHQALAAALRRELSPRARALHRVVCNMRTQFPDLRLIQYDCGMWVGLLGDWDVEVGLVSGRRKYDL